MVKYSVTGRLIGPPIAFGLDRLISILAGVGSNRDVIDFPQVGGGAGPLTDAPDTVADDQLDQLGLKLHPTS